MPTPVKELLSHLYVAYLLSILHFYFVTFFILFTFFCILSQASNNDSLCHKAVMAALKVIGFTADEISSIYKILGTILHLVSHFSNVYLSVCSF